MNYAIHYERLIERARSRSLVGYRERHHQRVPGKFFSQEQRKKLSVARRARITSQDTGPRISASLLAYNAARRASMLGAVI